MELDDNTEQVTAEELLQRATGTLEKMALDVEDIRHSQSKAEANVLEIHKHVVSLLGDNCPVEFKFLNVAPVITIRPERAAVTPADRLREQKRAKRAAHPSDDEESDHEVVVPGRSRRVTLARADGGEGGGGFEAGAGTAPPAKKATGASTTSALSPGKAPSRRGAKAAAGKAAKTKDDAKAPAASRSSPRKRDKQDKSLGKRKFTGDLSEVSLKDSSAIAARIKTVGNILSAARRKKVTATALPQPSEVLKVDHSTILSSDDEGHVIHALINSEGACVTYELSDTYDFGGKLNKAIATALATSGLSRPSQLESEQDIQDVCLSVVSDIVVAELSRFKYKPLHLEAKVCLDYDGLTTKEYSDSQPEPLRSAIWAVFKTLKLKDNETTVKVFGHIVNQVERYFKKLRLGQPPVDAKATSITHEDEDAEALAKIRDRGVGDDEDDEENGDDND